VLPKYHDYFFSSELQFGFKDKHSTHMCTMILKETLMYYNTNNSTAFCTFLDASKAFDRVRKLFRILIDRGLPPCIVRVLICLYANNKVRMAWTRVQSQYFLAINGVKQGGVMSPVLYLLMIYWLNCRTLMWDVFGPFADDLVLLAPSPTAMRKMLRICDEYAAEFSIKFNAKNSKWLAIIPRKRRWLASSVNFMWEAITSIVSRHLHISDIH